MFENVSCVCVCVCVCVCGQCVVVCMHCFLSLLCFSWVRQITYDTVHIHCQASCMYHNGHSGDEHFVHCSEVVPSSEVEMYGQLMAGGKQFVHCREVVLYRRFYCIL